MKKDKDWLKEEASKHVEIELSHEFGLKSGKYISLYTLEKLIDQLDEPEMTEEQAWNKIGEAYADSEKGRLMNAKKIFDNGLEMQGVINTVMFKLKKSNDDRTFEEFVIDSIKKTELPVIPQFVADWIEITKKSRWGILMLFDTSEMPNEEVDCWLTNTEDGPRNSELAARAWLDGYAIEQPKLLTIIVKDYDKTIMTKKLPEDEVNKMMEGLE